MLYKRLPRISDTFMVTDFKAIFRELEFFNSYR